MSDNYINHFPAADETIGTIPETSVKVPVHKFLPHKTSGDHMTTESSDPMKPYKILPHKTSGDQMTTERSDPMRPRNMIPERSDREIVHPASYESMK